MNPIEGQIIPQPIWRHHYHIISYLSNRILVLVPLLYLMRQLPHLIRYVEWDHLRLDHLDLGLSEKPVHWVADVVGSQGTGLWVESEDG